MGLMKEKYIEEKQIELYLDDDYHYIKWLNTPTENPMDKVDESVSELPDDDLPGWVPERDGLSIIEEYDA